MKRSLSRRLCVHLPVRKMCEVVGVGVGGVLMPGVSLCSTQLKTILTVRTGSHQHCCTLPWRIGL
jgi:hypothetical protein